MCIKHPEVLFLLFILVVLLAGCSSRISNPVSGETPNLENMDTPSGVDLPSVSQIDSDGHELMGSWTMNFDPETMTVSVGPNRELLTHFNVKSLLPSPGLRIISYDPAAGVLDIDVTVRNPYGISGYDVRVIIYTDSAGHTLYNSDGWTTLYDISGGMPINPFKAYAKTESRRLFAGGASHTENLKIKIPNGNFNVKFAIDASYPGNCDEPYAMSVLVQEDILYDRLNASTGVHLTVSNWNDMDHANVMVRCTAILGDIEWELDTDEHEYFYGNIYNFQDAPAGVYQAFIEASTGYPVMLYQIGTITVTEKPVYGWARKFPNDESIGGVENDEEGYVYFTLSPTDRVVKYTKEQTEVWQHYLSYEGYYRIIDLSYDPTLNYLYATGGYFSCGTTDYSGMSIARLNRTTANVHSVYECFTLPVSSMDVCSDTAGNTYNTGVYDKDTYPDPIMWKVDTSMNTSWINIFINDSGSMEFGDICSSSFDTIYGAGQFWGTIVDLDPSDTTYNVSPSGYRDAFLSEWNSSGGYVKIKRWGGHNDPIASSNVLAVGEDNADNIIVAGQFSGSVDFNPAVLEWIKTSQARLDDMYISKFDSSMALINCAQISSSEDIWPMGMDFDSSNNIYICGKFYETVDFDPGSGVTERTAVGYYDMFVAKYSSNLELVWVRTLGSESAASASDVSYDSLNNFLYVGGSFNGTIDFDPGEGIYELTSDVHTNAFLMKLTPDGLWE